MTQITGANDAAVSLQDEGTGVSNHNDPNSAANIGGALEHIAWGVLRGLNLSVDVSNETVTVSNGTALIKNPKDAKVQSNVQGFYDLEWYGKSVLPVSIGDTTANWDTTTGINYVYLNLDASINNNAEIVVSDTQDPSELTNASLYLGNHDTSDDSVDEPISRYYSDKPLRSDNGHIDNLTGSFQKYDRNGTVYYIRSAAEFNDAVQNAETGSRLVIDVNSNINIGDTTIPPGNQFIIAGNLPQSSINIDDATLSVNQRCTFRDVGFNSIFTPGTVVVNDDKSEFHNINLGGGTLDLQSDNNMISSIKNGTINNGSNLSNNQVLMARNVTFTGDTGALNTQFVI